MNITKARLKEIINEELEREMVHAEDLGPHVPQVDPIKFSEEVSVAVDALGAEEVMRIVKGVISTLDI